MNVAVKRYRIKSRPRFIIAMMIALLLVVSIVSTLANLNQAAGLSKVTYTQVEVQSGDTLWDIAKRHMPDDIDPRQSIQIISDLNQTTPSELQAGQILKIPTAL